MAKRVLIITGSRSLTRMLNALGSPKARALHRKALRKAVKPILAYARATAPKRTGALRGALTIRAAKRSRKHIGMVVTQKSGHAFKGDQFYGGFQEFGWKTGKRKRSQAPVDDVGKKRFVRERRKIPGKWFMRNAGTAKEQEAIDIYEAELETLIEQEAKK